MYKELEKDFSGYIIAHTGVGSTIDQEKVEKRMKIAKRCVFDAWKRLQNDHAIDASVRAVETAINTLENSGMVNAGVGAVKQLDGVQRLDSSIMRGRDLEYGAVASLREYKNPISVARMIMEDTDGHNMYTHDFAIQYAKTAQLPKIKETDILRTTNTKEGCDTVGAVARDFTGTLCAGTSTGGFGNCKPGRIGDSPIIGAGTYCNEICGVSITGRGENVVKLCLAKRVVDLVQFSLLHPQKAIDLAIEEYSTHFPEQKHTVGIIALDHLGRFGVNFKGQMMGWAAIVFRDKLNPIMLYGAKKGDNYMEKME